MKMLRFAYRCVSPPGYVLNTINTVLHKPIVAPLLLAIYWCVTCLLAVALTPLILLDGLHKAWSDAIATELAVEDRSAMAIVVTGCDTGFGRDGGGARGEEQQQGNLHFQRIRDSSNFLIPLQRSVK